MKRPRPTSAHTPSGQDEESAGDGVNKGVDPARVMPQGLAFLGVNQRNLAIHQLLGGRKPPADWEQW